MLEELVQIRRYIDEVIETYKDLHPDEELLEIGTTIGHGSMTIEEYEAHDRGNNTHLDGMDEYNQKQRALKRIREGYYEDTFRQEQGKTITKFSQGQVEKCILDDT